MFSLPNLEEVEKLVGRMEIIAKSMDQSARRTETAAKLMYTAAILNNTERKE
jgi:phosphoglycerate-specific signal transduction histidine kinase